MYRGHHQRIHRNSRYSLPSPHDSPPRHSPPHDPHYDYHNPYGGTSSASRSPCPHCRAPPTSFHADPASGDLVCTSCGAVLDERLRDETAEWIDYGRHDPEQAGRGMARCGDVAVDEERWAGGLVPMTVSSSFVPGGGVGTTADERRRLATVRNRLGRTHNMIENMLEQDRKARYAEEVLERRARDAAVARGEEEELERGEGGGVGDGDDVAVNGDYEGLMALGRDAQEPSKKRRRASAKAAETTPSRSEDPAVVSPADGRWSLEDAILLYGTPEQARRWCPDGGGVGVTRSSPDAERAARPTLRKLYAAFDVLEGAAGRLGLDGAGGSSDRVLREAAARLSEFARKTDGLRIGGVSGGPSRATELRRLRRDAALGSALLYLCARRLGVGRTLTEVCAAFGAYAIGPGVGGEGEGGNEGAELMVGPRHCSRAVQELRKALPGIVSPLETGRIGGVSTAAAVPSSCASSTSDARAEGWGTNEPPVGVRRLSPSASPPPVKSECTPGGEGDPSNGDVAACAAEAALADLTSRMAASLGLPPDAASAAIAVAAQCARDTSAASTPSVAGKRGDKGKGKKHVQPRWRGGATAGMPFRAGRVSNGDAPDDVIAASSLLLVCVAGGTMQRLARQALNGHRAPASKRKRGAKGHALGGSTSLTGDAGLISDPLDDLECELSHPSPIRSGAASVIMSSAAGSAVGAATGSAARRASPSSWSAWEAQPLWHRSVSQMERCTGVPRKAIVSHYSNAIYRRKSHFLGAATRGLGDSPLNVTAAAPLMSLRDL